MLFVIMEIADCYRVLGLRMGASYEDIKASYRRLARLYHPDSNLTQPQQTKEKFIQVTDAYRRLIEVIPAESSSKDTPAVNLRQARSQPAVKVTIKPTSSPASTKTPGPPLQDNPDLSPIDRQLKQRSYDQLQQFLKDQRFPRAIALVEGLAQRLPQDPEVRQWQAITYQRFGRFLSHDQQAEKARIYLKKALKTDPHNRSLWLEVDRDFRRIEQTELY